MTWENFLRQQAKEKGLSADLEDTLLEAIPSASKAPQAQKKIAISLNIWLRENNYQPEQFIDLVASKVVDNFMYLVCLIDALVKTEYKNFDLNELPPNLEQYYDLHWRRMGMTEPENRFKVMVIYTIKEIGTPIPKEAIADILETDLEAVEAVLNNWFQYFKLENVEGELCYNFYHLTFRKYIELREELDSDKPMFREVNQKIFRFLKQYKYRGEG
ncbi:hypothetical protein [Gloeothece verrucosa]|uniref:Uncharacterized protein n=1 Tax=Gloeothece verrucosa (strain PCC 7822) TaxID=497965 RepID=E0UEV6_GLOV7|nr:hypothetical protein [Gloeothece verrucosa]ADN13086.1 hypothetical protein Cyan7822_1078 [Gloeothece verrucosa PCC 7822]